MENIHTRADQRAKRTNFVKKHSKTDFDDCGKCARCGCGNVVTTTYAALFFVQIDPVGVIKKKFVVSYALGARCCVFIYFILYTTAAAAFINII